MGRPGTIMRVGITATREGLTPPQATRLEEVLRRLSRMDDDPVFAHGDCIGGDAEGHDIAEELGYDIAIYPCNIKGMRAWKKGSIAMPEKPPLDRNRDIVNFVEVLLVCPKGMYEEQRSGTWSTYRYARTRGLERIIIYPDGSEDREF
jgi:hypothetical protein